MYKDKIVEDYKNKLTNQIGAYINGRYNGNQGIVFKYDMTIFKDGDYLIPVTSFTGPAHSVKKTINGVEYDVIRDLPVYDDIPDSLYRDSLYLGKVIMKNYDSKIPKSIGEFVEGIYKHKYKAGDTVDLGNLTFTASIDFGLSDTVWAYDMSRSGYPDYANIRKEHNPDSLKIESYWHTILTKADFKKNFLYAKQEGGTVILKRPIKINLFYSKRKEVVDGQVKVVDIDETKILWLIDNEYQKDIERFLFLFEKQTAPSFTSEKNWYSAVGRDIEVLYKLFIHNNMVQYERVLFSAEYKEKEKERLEAEKQELAAKYGKANVDAAYNFSPRVGMPEELLSLVLALWSINEKSETSSSYTLYCQSKLDSQSRLSITVVNGKVTSFYTY
jgi:hypothetical protein